jgi:glycosyltransferase involved in cell wall biosynthesis
VVQILRSIAAAVRWLVSARLETAAFRALDGAVGLADLIGEQLPNRATPPAETARAGRTDLFVMVDTFPALSETFVWAEVQALARAGFAVRVEAMRRPVRQEPGALSIVPTRYVEDDSRAEKLVAVCWLVARHPLGCARDLIGRRRWKQSEEVLPLRGIAPLARRLARERSARLYCHFAAGAALNTMRIALLSRRPYALTAHAYDIFRDVRNLVEKLERAELVFTGCEYNVRHLRELVAPDARDRIHEVVMGVDPRVFRRTVPYPGGRRVIGAGRLVEKKGFADLIAAVARLEQVDELVIAGDGPLRSELQALAHELGIEDRVRLAGALEHRRLRDLLEHADVLAMPCVVASDGDRDSMPVVVKEALSLEIPVVATDEVGLPELVREPWGRLVPPHDPDAIAEALAEVLSLPTHDRIEMGRAGRAHVLEHCNVDREAAKLASLLSLTARASGSARKP